MSANGWLVGGGMTHTWTCVAGLDPMGQWGVYSLDTTCHRKEYVMTLDNSSEFIYCQTCANQWRLTDTREMFYFQSASFALGSFTSPALIVAAVEEMIFCPQCDVDQLTDAYRKPFPGIQESPFYDKDSRMIGADVDKGGAVEGDADVVHTPFVP